MIVHVIVLVAHDRKQRLRTHVLVGNRALDPELPDELLHLLEAVVVAFDQKLGEHHILGGPGGKLCGILLPPLPELLLKEIRDKRLAFPGGIEVSLIDQRKRDQRRFILERDPGVGIDVREPVARKRHPVLQCGIEQIRQRLERGTRQPFVWKLRNLPLRKRTRHIKIGGHVNAPFLKAGDQIVELIELLRIESGGTLFRAHRQTAVVMVQPDRIETKSGHPVSELLRPLLRKILRTGAEIGPIETNRLIGSIPERQLSVADHHRTVFPGRRIEAAGEIQRGPWQHILAVPDRLPVPSRNNVHRRTREARNPLISDRGSDDAPDGTAGRSEGDLPDRLVFNRERRAVKSDKRTGVGSRPGKFTVPAGHRSPPVPDIDVSRDRDLGGGSVLIDNPDPANLPETRRPGQSVKQKQIVAADRRFHPDGGLTGEIAA